MANAGNPPIMPLPPAQDAYEVQLRQAWASVFQSSAYAGAKIQMVEIDPLLTYQPHLDTHRAAHHYSKFNGLPDMNDLLATCLPLAQATEMYQVFQQPQSIILRARNLNIVLADRGMQGNFLGVRFGISLPLVHVVRLNGRYYLHNGLHRVYGARSAGATHVPCMVRDVDDPDVAGIRTDGRTFPLSLLESTNPPTVGHYTQGRACEVQLRTMNRVLHVSWAEYTIPVE